MRILAFMGALFILSGCDKKEAVDDRLKAARETVRKGVCLMPEGVLRDTAIKKAEERLSRPEVGVECTVNKEKYCP